jgi:CSLREA domain-containing protein
VCVAVGLVLSLSAGAASPVRAAGMVVDTTADETTNGDGCSLREAVANANADAATYPDCAAGTGVDTITFSVTGTITLTSGALPTISDADGLTISGSGQDITISGQDPVPETQDHRHFFVAAGARLALNFLTLTHGRAAMGTSGIGSGGPGASGGSILNDGTLDLFAVEITDSRAGEGGGTLNGGAGRGGDGGAIANTATGTLNALGVTLAGNKAGRGGTNGGNSSGQGFGGDGGAIYNGGGTVTIANATLYGNRTGQDPSVLHSGDGGAIDTRGGTVTVIFSTLNANELAAGGHGYGIASEEGANVYLANTILADALGEECFTGFADPGVGTFHDSGGNLQDAGSCGFGVTADPKLDPAGLQDNGGWVRTIGLQADSPAINAIGYFTIPGYCLTYFIDARGFSRPVPALGNCDIGAFELQKTAQVITFAQPTTPATYGSTFNVDPTSDSGLGVSLGAAGGCSAAAVATGFDVTMTSGTTSCVLTASQAGDDSYAAATDVVRTVLAQKKPLTVTADDKSKTFGGSAPSFSVHYSPFAPGDGAGDLGGSLAFTFAGINGTTYGPSTSVPTNTGSYSITPSGYSSDDYSFSYWAGTYTIQQATQAIAITTHAPGTATAGSSFSVAATGGGSGNAVTFGHAGVCTNLGATFTMTSGTGTCTVKYDQAGNANYFAAPQLTEDVTASKIAQAISFTSTAPAAAVYGDSYSPTATGGASGNPVTFGASGACSYAAGVVTMTVSGTCTVTANQAGNADYDPAPQVSQIFSVGKKPASLGFTGNLFWSTGSATATSTTVTLTGLVTPAPGGTIDLTRATVTFDLYKSTNVAMTSPDATCAGTVNASGVGSCARILSVDNWTVIMEIPASNLYFTAPDSDPIVLTVYAPTTGKFATAGGWVVDPSYRDIPVAISPTNNHGNFGFSVKYKTGTTPMGQSVYVFRGANGYNYVAKSNSWVGGGVAFGTNNSSLSGKCNVTVINPATGLVVTALSGGNYTYRVDVTDNGSTGDTYAISIYAPGGVLYHRTGTAGSQLALRGGNVVVHTK